MIRNRYTIKFLACNEPIIALIGLPHLIQISYRTKLRSFKILIVVRAKWN